jgi:O-antigen/teichoic acid export membrane protein
MASDDTKIAKVIDTAKTAAKGSILVFVGNTLSTFILMIASIIIARLLGPSNYGLYSITLIPISLSLLFTDFGVRFALTKFIANLRTERKYDMITGLIKAGFLFEVLISSIIFILMILFADIIGIYLLSRSDIGFLIQIASLVIIGSTLVTTVNSIFIGFDHMNHYSLISIIQAIIKLILGPTLIILGFGVLGALIGHIAGYIIAGIIGTLLVFSMYKYHGDINFSNHLIPMIKYGIPLYTSGFISGLLGQYASIILARSVSNIEIGNYYVATVFSTAINLLITPISTVLFPAFSKFNINHDQNELKIIFTNSLRYALFLIIPASTFITFNSPELIRTFYGSNYLDATPYLTLYSITFYFSGFSLVLSNFFNGIGRTDISLKTTTIQLPFIISLVPLLTWFYRVPGFILASIISSLIGLTYLGWTAYHEYNLNLNLKYALKTLTISIISSLPALTLTFIPHHLIRLITSAIIFIIIYLTLAPLMKIIENKDINNLTLITKDSKLTSTIFTIALSYENYILSKQKQS